jgi:hypothetical protein
MKIYPFKNVYINIHSSIITIASPKNLLHGCLLFFSFSLKVTSQRLLCSVSPKGKAWSPGWSYGEAVEPLEGGALSEVLRSLGACPPEGLWVLSLLALIGDVSIFWLMLLGVELRALRLLSRHATILTTPTALLALVIFEIQSYFMPRPAWITILLFVLPFVAQMTDGCHCI